MEVRALGLEPDEVVDQFKSGLLKIYGIDEYDIFDFILEKCEQCERELEERVDEMEREIDELEDELDEKERKIEDLEGELNDKECETAQLEKTISNGEYLPDRN